MAKVATDFMKCHNWTSETPSSELAKYTEEINKSLKDDRKCEEGRDTVDKIAQEIVDNDYLSEKIKQISYDLGSSAPNPVAGSSRLTLLQKKLQDRGADHSKREATKIPHITTESNEIQAHRHIFDEDEGFECLNITT
ncbi:unnamed protein product [Rhizophagus irregularis]|uniref:Uncharacterized protein n=1 Tax=Rhizophagus irregularis TaxID=588596 RepID=A0A2N1MBF9_9GLOM|nr:hypothetical protein RhiirC2_795510 [Rhizophagus irregularis]CAB4379527.1 unnamed protein product [Rhizophagus irregularis]